MKYQQRDVVWVKESLPDGQVLRHPFLIISCRAANSKETYYTAVMMTSSAHRDMFSFNADDNMFERPLGKKGCQFRLYILVSFPESKIEDLFNRMNKADFKALIQQIKDYILSVD